MQWVPEKKRQVRRMRASPNIFNARAYIFGVKLAW